MCEQLHRHVTASVMTAKIQIVYGRSVVTEIGRWRNVEILKLFPQGSSRPCNISVIEELAGESV